MGILRDQVHPEGFARALRPLAPFVPTVWTPPAVGTPTASGSSIFANQGYFYAQCQASDAVGNCVYANSTEAFVSTADESQDYPVIGIIVAKQGDTNCTVQRFGESAISYSGLETGKRYFLGPNGSILAPPFDDEMPEYVQQVGNAISSTLLFIQPTGQVIKRIINKDFVLNLGDGDPQANGLYPRTDLYIDRSAMTACLSPTMEGEDSVILVGDGPPSAEQTPDAQAVYRDGNGNLYFADGSGSVPSDLSALIFGSLPPNGSETPANNVYYLNNEGLGAYPRTGVTGVS